MKVEKKGNKLVVSDELGSLEADITGLTKNQIRKLARKMQIDILEGNTVYDPESVKPKKEVKKPKKKVSKKKTSKKKEE